MYYSSHLSSRNQFGQLLNDSGLTGLGVEIGTHRGEFARILLSHWEGKRLHCIDPWVTPPAYQDQALRLPEAGKDRSEDLKEAERVLGSFGGRVYLYHCTSEEAVYLFPNEALDFVYLDGDHSFSAISKDLYLWWDRLKSGGILAGHDWLCPGEVGGLWGRAIQMAVHNFTQWMAVDTYLIVEENGLPWSFYLVKP